MLLAPGYWRRPLHGARIAPLLTEAAHRRLENWAAGLNLLAGAGHFGVTADHFEQWWGYGLFFVASGTAQVVLALALWTRAVNPTDSGPSWRRLKAWMYGLGAGGNAAIIVLYLVTRTVGIPNVGPEGGEVEAVALYDVVVTLGEAVAVVLLLILLRRIRRPVEAVPAVGV